MSTQDSDSFEDIMGAVLDCHVIILDVLERPDETLKIIRGEPKLVLMLVWGLRCSQGGVCIAGEFIILPNSISCAMGSAVAELRTVEFMGNKTLIVLSSFMSWSATIKDPDNPEVFPSRRLSPFHDFWSLSFSYPQVVSVLENTLWVCALLSGHVGSMREHRAHCVSFIILVS